MEPKDPNKKLFENYSFSFHIAPLNNNPIDFRIGLSIRHQMEELERIDELVTDMASYPEALEMLSKIR